MPLGTGLSVAEISITRLGDFVADGSGCRQEGGDQWEGGQQSG